MITQGARVLHAATGNKLTAKGWGQEAALRMLHNNLDPAVAEHPENLVVYGGTGKAARNWQSFDALVKTLTNLKKICIFFRYKQFKYFYEQELEKTKKQKLENTTMNPIICIGNYCIDKKIRELTKVCNTFEIKLPTIKQMKQILLTMFPELNTRDNLEKQNTILDYIQCDVRKLNFVYDVYKTNPRLFDNNALSLIFQQKSNNEDSKRITQTLLNNYIPLNNHSQFMNETERTIVALLWHENVVDMIEKYDKKKSIPIYQKILEKMSYADYIDRITFQNQIWQFNEMSSLMKTFHNNKIYHDNLPENKNKFQPSEVRFTKVLTKYSTEYNNMMFIYGLCQELDLDKSDLISIFQEIRLLKPFNMLTNIETMNEIEEIFENYNINKLDIQRIYRYMDKSVKKDMVNPDLEDTE